MLLQVPPIQQLFKHLGNAGGLTVGAGQGEHVDTKSWATQIRATCRC